MNREWSRGGEPLRSREGYSELTEDWRKLFGGYLDLASWSCYQAEASGAFKGR